MCVFYGFTICLVISACSRWRFVPFGGLFCSEACSVRCLVLFGGIFAAALHPTGACAGPTAKRSYSRRRSYNAVVLQPQAVYKKACKDTKKN